MGHEPVTAMERADAQVSRRCKGIGDAVHAEMIPTGFETLMRLAQDRRLIRVKTVLEEETFVVKHFTGVEEVSAPYTFDIELLSAQAGLQLKQLIGQPLRLSLGDEFDGRVVHGYVREFAQVGKQGELSAYRCELAPWFAFLQYTSNCRIFQDLNVLDIIERVFDGYPQLADYAHDLDAARYPKLSYCVQYNESDFQFVSRLLEDAGIYYAFRHSDDAHTMVLSDDSTSSEQFGEPASIEFVSDQGTLQRPGVHRWAARRRWDPRRMPSRVSTSSSRGLHWQPAMAVKFRLVHFRSWSVITTTALRDLQTVAWAMRWPACVAKKPRGQPSCSRGRQ